MIEQARRASRTSGPRRHPLRVGLLGILGSGNLGNEASLEAVLHYLRTEHPEATLRVMSSGPDRVTERHGLPARHLHWHHTEPPPGGWGRLVNLARVAIGIVLDAPLTALWVRQQDVVIVPGAGVLESTLPVRPWQLPYSLFLLSMSGRLFRTRVALVSVGANVVPERLTRWLLVQAAQHASYRSYRDEHSKASLRAMGIDVSGDQVYPDLAFALPRPSPCPTDGTIGLGIIDYTGRTADVAHAEEIYSAYMARVTHLVERLLQQGHAVRLFGGDLADHRVARTILGEMSKGRDLSRCILDDEPVQSWTELTQVIAPTEAVIASRFHNVLCALALAKPTISLSYAAKNDTLMVEMGLPGYSTSILDFDPDAVSNQLEELLRRRDDVAQTLSENSDRQARHARSQFEAMSAALFRA